MISAETYNADYEKAVKFGYNKGIDEFEEKLKELVSHSFGLCWSDIENLAEQLKGE